MLLVIALAVAFAGAAMATQLTTDAEAHVCGYNYDEVYTHCGTTHVLITAEDFWGTEYTLCVGPGDTSLGYLSYWRITGAWYIGYLC
jgi:hypothetical protein